MPASMLVMIGYALLLIILVLSNEIKEIRAWWKNEKKWRKRDVQRRR